MINAIIMIRIVVTSRGTPPQSRNGIQICSRMTFATGAGPEDRPLPGLIRNSGPWAIGRLRGESYVRFLGCQGPSTAQNSVLTSASFLQKLPCIWRDGHHEFSDAIFFYVNGTPVKQVLDERQMRTTIRRKSLTQ